MKLQRPIEWFWTERTGIIGWEAAHFSPVVWNLLFKLKELFDLFSRTTIFSDLFLSPLAYWCTTEDGEPLELSFQPVVDL